MRAVILLLAAVASSCSSSNDPATGRSGAAATPALPDSIEFRGIYSAGFEAHSFQPCASTERWWVADAGPLARAYAQVARPYEQVYAIVRGDTSRLGLAGHLGLYQRYMRIHSVISVTPLEQQQFGGAPRCPGQ